jgi:hypothetical protein
MAGDFETDPSRLNRLAPAQYHPYTTEEGENVTNTPAVGMCGGTSNSQRACLMLRWPPAGRSALLGLVIVLGSVGLLALGGGPVMAAPNSVGLRATYEASASIRWSRGAIIVSSTARVRNTTSDPVTQLTFHLLPLRLGQLELREVTVGNMQVTPTVSDQSLVITLPTALPPGELVRVTINYRAFFNTTAGGKRWLLMKKDGVVTAYRWIPWLSRAQPFKTPNTGESWVTGVSPRVTARLTSDVPLRFATSGRRTGVDGMTQTFVATDVRDFNFTASGGYKVQRRVWNGITVKVYHRSQSPDTLMSWTIRALERFSDKVGPYPYSRLRVAETPAGSGMESPALTWVSATVSPANLPYIVVHETAHQWFYAGVGNNQARHPYVDEAVSDFLTRDLLGSFRRSECEESRLDKSVYQYGARCYGEVIYVQGGRYLEKYRQDVGDEAFWRGLSRFYRDNLFRVAGTRSLLDHLDAAAGVSSERHAERFPSVYPVLLPLTGEVVALAVEAAAD